jgi:hypothetical protein
MVDLSLTQKEAYLGMRVYCPTRRFYGEITELGSTVCRVDRGDDGQTVLPYDRFIPAACAFLPEPDVNALTDRLLDLYSAFGKTEMGREEVLERAALTANELTALTGDAFYQNPVILMREEGRKIKK